MFDALFTREYDRNKYNCAHLVADAWEIATGKPLPASYGLFTLPIGERRADTALRADFLRLDAPSPPCVVLMTRPRFQPHVGLFWADKVLHITEQGVAFQPLDVVSVGFTKIRFYQCRET